jgi:ATP-dependent RNA helicase DeaD
MDCFSPDHPLTRALVERGYTDLTPVQSAVLAADARGRDLLVSAQTGSGKTVAYGLALADPLLGEALELGPAGRPLALVIAPTRELALQVQNELSWLYAPAGGQVASCVGGMDPRAERRRLAHGAHIVVGTPGRLRDHLERGALDPSALRAVVLDEADEMLDMGFREDLEFLLEATPADRRTLLFSATLPREIVALAKRYQRDAWRIAVGAGTRGHADIEHKVVRIAPTETEHAVVNLLRFYDAPTALVFCGTRESVTHLQAGLQERGFGVVALSGELSQAERNRALQALRDGGARVCVATDVAARGIDLPSLDLVIHAELPRTAETLQHRSGRTGRAGRKGISVLLVPLSRRRRADQLLKDAGVEGAWSKVPTADDIRALDQQRLLDHRLLAEKPGEDDLAMARALLETRSPEEIAAALVRLYRAQLPAAEEVFEPAPETPARERRQTGASRGERSTRPQRSTVWFRLNIGRRKNGDPRWLLPLICRQGRIGKPDVGAIRVLEHETRFEVDASVADRFLAAFRQVPHPEGRIEPLAGDIPSETFPVPADRQAKSESRRPEGRPARKSRPPTSRGDEPLRRPRERAAARG